VIAAATNFARLEFILWGALLFIGIGLGWVLRGRADKRKRHDATVGGLIEKRS
jgi:hypothetical protein